MLDTRPHSELLYADSCKLMPAGVNSPVRSFRAMQMTPMMVKEGKGDQLVDVDSHTYIDMCLSWGSLILGHSPDSIVARIQEQIAKGTSFGIATPFEKELAEKITQHIPSMQRLRFVSSGTEATMSAIRLARGYTGKSKIVKFNGHYHGHSDSLLVQAGSGVTHLPKASSLGVPEALTHLTASLPFNDLVICRDYLRTHDDIAAIILEPIAANMGVVPADRNFIQMLREESEKKGIVLIFDEVVTGFRVGLNGAQGFYNVTPDLTCLGKIIGGGFPAAAFGGKKEIMDCIAPLGGVYQAGTLSGNPIAMCAGLETLKIIERPGFYEDLERKTTALLAPLRTLTHSLKLPITIQSIGSMFTIFFGVDSVHSKEDLQLLNEEMFTAFFKFMFNKGIYLSPSAYEAHFLSSAHTEKNLAVVQQAMMEFFVTAL